MKALALSALVALAAACGPTDGAHFSDVEPLEEQAKTDGSAAGTDGSLEGATDGGVGRQDTPSGSDGLGSAGTSGLGTQPTASGSGGSDSSGDGSGGAASTDSGSGGSDSSGGAGSTGSADSSSTGGSGGSGPDSSGGASSGSADGSGGSGGEPSGSSDSGSGGSSDGSGGSDSTSGAGGGTDSCPNPRAPLANTVPEGSSGPFGTTDAVCYRLDFSPAEHAGWGCSNAADRSVTINGTSVSCGETPLPEPVMGAYFFEFGDGKSPNAAFYWFRFE